LGARFTGDVVALTQLSLTNFRSYAAASVIPGPGLVVLTGENGAGKTNVLEAISLLCPGRGVRGATLADIAQTPGPGNFAVSARIGGSDIGTGTHANAPNRRVVRINGATATATALCEWLSLTWLTPAMDRLFTESASERRRFLDRLVLAFEPAHAHHASRYDAAMRQRNRLLSEDGVPDSDWLSALELQMAEHGSAITDARQRFVALLSPRLSSQAEGPFARPKISLLGGNFNGDLAADLARNRAQDSAAGRSLIGPHRTDFSVQHVEKRQDAARCSTGEQKALLLNLVLTHADVVSDLRQMRPILLLDEVAAHLDPVRRHALFERLEAGGSQVWMTGTEKSLFSDISSRATFFTVEDGQIKA
jgi:DNA replication and repair protein RecF